MRTSTTRTTISQRDLMISWHSLATSIHRTLAEWDVRSTTAQENGYLHVWQLTAYFLGVEEVYIPATWDDADYQSDLTLDPVIAPTPEGIKLADVLLNLMAEYDHGLTRPTLNAMARYMVEPTPSGRSIADMLEIPKDRRPAVPSTERSRRWRSRRSPPNSRRGTRSNTTGTP